MSWEEWWNNLVDKCSMYQLRIALHIVGVILTVVVLVILIKCIIRNFKDNRK